MTTFRPDASDQAKPSGLVWSGLNPVPAIGDRVSTKGISLSQPRVGGVVTGYFIEYGWVGVHVQFEKWTNHQGHVMHKCSKWLFGLDLDPS